MRFEKTIIFKDPPTKYIQQAKKKTELLTNKRTGRETLRLKQTTHYLTVNLWYSADVNFSVLRKIINFSKDYLLMVVHGHNIPQLTNVTVHFEYFRMDENFDIDNKIGFWCKIFLDLLKKPSTKEVLKAKKHKQVIKSLDVIIDDNVTHLKGYSAHYTKGEHRLEITIKGDLIEKQTELF